MNGNSLAEFAVTTAMMATLAATAAPQFGSVGEGAKEKKTMNNIIITPMAPYSAYVSITSISPMFGLHK